MSMKSTQTKRLSLDAFKAKSELEKVDVQKLGGLDSAGLNSSVFLAACHDEPKTRSSSTCLFPSGYNSCRCC